MRVDLVAKEMQQLLIPIIYCVTGDDVDGGEGKGKGHSRTISDASFISTGSGSQGMGMCIHMYVCIYTCMSYVMSNELFFFQQLLFDHMPVS